MTRELVRRSCGHLEAVYAVGSGVRRIREKEKECCGICWKRKKSTDLQDLKKGKPPEKDFRKLFGKQDLSGDVRDVLNERKNDGNQGGKR
jgi:hypothetical protein